MSDLSLSDISKALTEDIVDKAFKEKTKSGDSVKRISVTRAAPAGEGLLSAVYRIRVIGNCHNASFVAKGLVKNELLRSSLNCLKYFKREAQFFSDVLPAFLKVQKTLGAKENLQTNIPVCFHWLCDGRNDYLLLEDLTERGCQAISKNLTLKERNATLRTLAHFHAASFALRIKDPDLFTKIANELHEIYFYDDNRRWYDDYLQTAIKFNTDALADYEKPETSVYYKKFKELLKEDVYSQLINLVSERGDIPVICHGDSWCSNFLYSDERSVVIDFQLIRCASPATDLAYFIIVSNLCRSKKDFNDAVDVYYLALTYYLKNMKLNANQIPSRATFEDELKRFGKYGFLASLSSFALLASERCDMIKPNLEYEGYDRIPLMNIWRLTPFQTKEDKMQLVNAVHVAVDAGLI